MYIKMIDTYTTHFYIVYKTSKTKMYVFGAAYERIKQQSKGMI